MPPPSGDCHVCHVPFGPEHDYTCARHSGIPGCCARFFADKWMPLVFHGGKAGDRERVNYMKWAHAHGGFEYVPCPKCVETANVKRLRNCDCYKPFRRTRTGAKVAVKRAPRSRRSR